MIVQLEVVVPCAKRFANPAIPLIGVGEWGEFLHADIDRRFLFLLLLDQPEFFFAEGLGYVRDGQFSVDVDYQAAWEKQIALDPVLEELHRGQVELLRSGEAPGCRFRHIWGWLFWGFWRIISNRRGHLAHFCALLRAFRRCHSSPSTFIGKYIYIYTSI